MDGIIDFHMPDLKYMDSARSMKYSGAQDYPEIAKAAIKEMHERAGNLI